MDYYLRLLTIFVITFSLATLSSSLASSVTLPQVNLAHACVGTACPFLCTTGSSGGASECWHPAGPEMSTELVNVFTTAQSEYTNLVSFNPSIDFTDSPVPAQFPIGGQLGGPGYVVTATIPEQGYYEIQFLQSNTFWTCNFQFGNSACGVQIRQGIAHMIDRSVFAATDLNIPAGHGIAIDDPVPISSGGNLLSANSCGWDHAFPEQNITGTPCTVGGGSGQSIGGASYHLATATGVSVSGFGCPWCQAPGSNDLNAAAQHFVNAGFATGFNSATSVLTGLALGLTTCGQASSGCVVPNFFIRNDDLPRLDLGNAYTGQICYLFTGSYTTPCTPFLTVTYGIPFQFPGLVTCVSTGCPSNNWWFYTGAFIGTTFYDDSLYHTYNSRFVSAGCPFPGTPSCTNQQIGGGFCSNQSVDTSSAADYMYICSPRYDTLSNQLENSPCLSAAGDPVAGATSNLPTPPNNGLCGNGSLSSHSAAIQAEDFFGQNVFTLPVFELRVEFGYLLCQPPGPCTSSNSWIRAINDAGVGLPNYFTWLNAYNPGPAIPGTIRQGFATSAQSVNPYMASTPQDFYLVNNVYDSLTRRNPLSTSQSLDWMAFTLFQEQAVSYNGGLSGPPQGTLATYRFVLRNDIMWQDGRPVTAYDVAFSYLSLVGSGAFLGVDASSMTGITILNPLQFDISVNSTGPFVLQKLTSLPILPGYYWSNAGGGAWTSAENACSRGTCQDVQYTLTGSTVNCAGACANFPASLMTVNPAGLAPSYDPITHHTFVGSGPWQCGIVISSSGSGTCDSPVGPSSGATSFTLTANIGYFRSSSRAAFWIWSLETDLTGMTIAVAAFVGSCFNLPVDLAGRCSHWQQGIGNPGSGSPVGISQVAAVDSLFLVNWVAPFDWGTNPPLGIGAFPPVLYALMPFDGSTTLTPAPGPAYNPIGCSVPNTFYNC